MLYAGSPALRDLGYVVLDEVHYLADRSRGAVWEEVIIHLPESVRVVALSATVSNAEEFGDWLAQVRGGTEVIVDEHRPVPLWQHMLAGRRLYDLFTDDDHHQVNPELVRLAQREDDPAARRAGPGRGGHRPRRTQPPYRPEIIDRLDAAGLLPAITFIFSRAGCDAAVQQCLPPGLRLTTPDEARAHRGRRRAAHRRHPRGGPHRPRLPRLGRSRCAAASPPTTPGMLPVFKEVVEELFTAGPGPGGLRHRDPRARHQHARPHRGAREARQVERRGPRRAHAGGVHPAHRPGRPARHRRRGARGGAVAAGPRPGRRRRAGRHPDLPAELELPPVLQHGGQPDRPRRPRSARPPCSSRASPSSRPTGAWSGWPGGCAGSRRRRRTWPRQVSCDRGDFMEYAELRRRLTDAERGASRSRALRAAGRGPARARHAAPRRHHPRPGRPPVRPRGGAQPAAGRATGSRRTAPTARSCSPRTASSSSCRRRTSRCRPSRSTGCASRSLVQRALAEAPPRSRLRDAREDRGPRPGVRRHAAAGRGWRR